VYPVTSEIPDQENSERNTAKEPTNNQSSQSHAPLPPRSRSLNSPPAPPSNPPSNEEPSQWRENTKLGLEIFGLLVLICYTVFSCLQWLQIRWTNRLTREALDGSSYSLQQTLTKMQGQINEMHELATQAGKQADRTKDVADRALLQANATNRLANAAQTQASGTNESVAVARDTLIANARPWMNAEIHISGPLTFDKTGAMYLPVVYALENTGHSPAINVWSQVELYLPHNPQVDTQKERERVCGQAAEGSKMNGQTVFPGGAHPVGEVDTALNNEAVQKGQIFKDFINPAIIVCIAYQTTLEKNIWHYTGLTFDIHEMSPTGGMVAIQIGKDVPLDRLKFSLSFFRGVVAN
jgi:hypothetical protein